MAVRFCSLASGSSANAGLLMSGELGVLIDCGLGPQALAGRLAEAGTSLSSVRAVVLTHTHGDHWKARTLDALYQHEIPLYCHPDHLNGLGYAFTELARLEDAGLVRPFADGVPFGVEGRVTVTAFRVSHDSRPTFGFRLEDRTSLFEPAWAMAYASDLGTWGPFEVERMANVDLLALEFNHDENLERKSGRPRHLITRVLGDEGHLSNRQAADCARAVLAASIRDPFRHLVLLHLSRHCNRPAIAEAFAEHALRQSGSSARVVTATQDRATAWLPLSRVKAGGLAGRRGSAGSA